jgi:hypothetical protein
VGEFVVETVQFGESEIASSGSKKVTVSIRSNSSSIPTTPMNSSSAAPGTPPIV